MTKPSLNPDLQVAAHGRVFLLRGRTEAAFAWIEVNAPKDATRLGPAIGVNRDQVIPLVKNALAAGLQVVTS